MHPSLKNVTERAQKYNFSVNIPIYIAYNKSIGLNKTFQL